MNVNNIQFINVHQNGDATSDYDVKFNESFTVFELLAWISDRKEWGYISINKPFWCGDGCVLAEYRDDNFFNVNMRLASDVLNKKVTKIEASGGWSRMDYTVYV